MMGGDIFSEESFKPLTWFGVTNPLFDIHIRTVTQTWIMMLLLMIAMLIFRHYLGKKESIIRHLVLSYLKFFRTLCTQTLETFNFGHFCFITAIFSFIFFNNILPTIPWLEEPTNDLNTTLALGITSFLYAQTSAIRTNGIKAYIKEYFSPFFLMFPLHVMGNLSSILSISFRLFGNIFGGSVIMKIYFAAIASSAMVQFLGIFSGINLALFLFFVLFEGLIQAFVFSTLSLTYLSMAVHSEEEI